MTRSSLTDYVKLSPNYDAGRAYKVSKITVHHMAGNLSVERCGEEFASPSRKASANYGIGSDGRVGCYVEEQNAAWTSASWWNDNHAITIEVANSSTGGEWPVSGKAWNSLVRLCADVCRRYGFRLSYTGGTGGSLTEHRMYAATLCPGPYLHARMSKLAKEVNAMLDGGSVPSGGSSVKVKKVNVTYCLKQKASTWLEPVTNWNASNSQGFAGMPFGRHDGFWAKVSRGSIRYRLHNLGGGWTAWAKDGEKKTVKNCIDGIQVYYVTPSGETYQQAWYRSQTTDRSGWLDVCCDDGTTYADYDAWAGMYGEPLDRLQLAIGTSDPF